MSTKDKDIKNEQGWACCKVCKRKNIIAFPEVRLIGDLHYAYCPNDECNHKYGPYEFLGITPKGALRHWNDVMERKDTQDY